MSARKALRRAKPRGARFPAVRPGILGPASRPGGGAKQPDGDKEGHQLRKEPAAHAGNLPLTRGLTAHAGNLPLTRGAWRFRGPARGGVPGARRPAPGVRPRAP
jgi:hypothetical protein